METIKKSLEKAKIPGKISCPNCGDELFSPIDKLSIYLYGECPIHLNETKEDNLLKISECL
jgi:hypothetical protein